MRLLEVRSQLYGAGIARQGLLEAAKVAQGIPQVPMRRSHAAIDAHGSLQEFDGTLRPSGLRGKHAAQMQGHNQQALEIVRRVLSLNPDSEAALKLERELIR